jgi:hypothetical protein
LLNAEDAVAKMEANEMAGPFNDDELEQMTDDQIQELMAQAIANNDEDEIDDADELPDDDELINETVGQLRQVKVNVTTGFMEEKAAAIHALTSFIKNSGSEFIKYMDDVWERLTVLWEYPHSLVKISVSQCFHEFFTVIVNNALKNEASAVKVDKDSNDLKYPYEQNIDVQYDQNVTMWIENILPLYVQAIHDEEDKDALNVILDHFIDEIKILGPNSLQNLMDDLIGAVNNYLSEKCACQQSSDIQNTETKDIATKHKWISDTVADLIATLAELWGKRFDTVFERLFDSLLKFGRPSRHPQDQAMVVGCIADCCSRLEKVDNHQCTVMTRFAPKIVPLALRIAQATDVNMRQNALYCLGAVFTCSDSAANLKHAQDVLKCIKAYMEFPKNGSRPEQLVRDNAVSALGKVLISEPRALPTADLLPAFIDALPLTCDFTENQYVYDVLRRFVLNYPQLIQSQIDKALQLLAMALSNDEVPQETTDAIVAMFQQICKNQKIQSIVQQKLSPDAQQNIIKATQNL